jgi:hypothetical protein
MMQQLGVLPVSGRLAGTLATEIRRIPVEQSYLASPSRFPVTSSLMLLHHKDESFFHTLHPPLLVLTLFNASGFICYTWLLLIRNGAMILGKFFSHLLLDKLKSYAMC